jgi:hypothetical protein
VSHRKRKRIEECFGWLKAFALRLHKVRHRGIVKVDWSFVGFGFEDIINSTMDAARRSRYSLFAHVLSCKLVILPAHPIAREDLN